MNSIKFSFFTNFAINPANDGYQLIYGTQAMGTNFDIYGKLTFVDYSKDKKECAINRIDLEIINYKGALNFGFLNDETKKTIKHENTLKYGPILNKDGKEKKGLILEVGLKGAVNDTTTNSTTIILEEPLVITHGMGMVAKRKFFPLAGNEDIPIVNGIFDDLFYTRNGAFFMKKVFHEIPDAQNNTNVKSFNDLNVFDFNAPGGYCKSGNIKFLFE